MTTQGGGGASLLLKPLGLETTDITDVFSGAMRDIKKHVASGDFGAAEGVLLKEQEFFKKRLADRTQPLPAELTRLGDQLWATRYQSYVGPTTQQLAAVQSLANRASWQGVRAELERARLLEGRLNSDIAIDLLRVGQEQRSALKAQTKRVSEMASGFRSQALAMTFGEVLTTGTHDSLYVQGAFSSEDYQRSSSFQLQAQAVLVAPTTRDGVSAAAQRLAPYLSAASKQAADERYMELAKQEVLADGRVTLDELGQLNSFKSPFGSATEVLSQVARVGYVDLTSASFKNRNIFDFEISFKKDLPLTFAAADESLFRNADWPAYDFLFVTDLAVAKVARDFKSRQQVKSRMLTGTREEQNPEYIGAVSRYETAMTEYRRAAASAAMPKACGTPLACLAVGLVDGLAQGNAKKQVDEASQMLARTSRTVSIPVYGEYTYQSVDISTSKSADVNYYVVDIKGRQILSSSFQKSDNARYNVAYNVRDEDPEKSSILRNVKSEDEVTSWEKRPMEVSLSALFSAEGLKGAKVTPLTSVPAFVASLSSKDAVPAAPTYAATAPSPSMQAAVSAPVPAQATATAGRVASGPNDAQTIADERFDSIVVIQNPGSVGTGFYVTPDLVLTAYHVVQNNSLVQMTFYNGTKTFGRVVNHDVRLDLALVRAQTAGKPLRIHTGPIKLGETVEAIGHPKGYEFTITRGVISAVRRQRSANIGSDTLVEFVQTDTPISPGNSGGPLLLRDSVIGVNDWIRVDKGAQNLNFSVSYNELRTFLDRSTGK